MTTIPPCATRCGLVESLLAELARARGVSVDVMRVGHGLDLPQRPDLVEIPDKAGTLLARTQPQNPVRHEETTA